MILIYAEEITPRVEYITKLIFTQILKVEIALTTNSAEFIRSELPKFNYSFEKFGNEFYIKPHWLIFKRSLNTPNINPVWYEGQKYFCESSKDSILPFDPLAASFYVVTRHEEYTEKRRDKLGRYSAQHSILTRYNLLHKPVVNIWAKLLATKLKEFYPDLHFPETHFQFISTIDVDNAWAYLHKGFWRTTAAFAKSLFRDIKEFNERKSVILRKTPDPYDTYTYLNRIFKGNEEKVRFFFLLADYARFDKNIAHQNKHYRKLIKRISRKYSVGIHPSFASSKKGGRKKTTQERARLEEIIGHVITASRQHFLRLKLPKSYRRLIKSGITTDYTMGYAAKLGFRAGICTPHYFYDLERETQTNLLIIPFQMMDGTLKHYLKLSPDEAFEETRKIMEEVKNVGGTFVSIWHNETVNDQGHWAGYRQVFEQTHNLAFEWANQTINKEEALNETTVELHKTP